MAAETGNAEGMPKGLDRIIGIVFVFVYVQMFRDRRWFLGLWGVVGVCGATSIIYPQLLLGMYGLENGAEIHFLMQVLGSLVLASSVTIFAMEYTQDQTVQVTLSTARILSYSCVAFTMINSAFFENDKSTFSYSDMIGTPLLIIYDIIMMPRLNRHNGSLTVGDPLSFHLTFDFFITFVLSILMLAFPNMFLATILPDTPPLSHVHVCFTQFIGCFYLQSAITSLCSLSFKQTEDVENILKVKLLNQALVIFSIVLTMVYHNEFANVGQLSLMFGVNGLLLANSYIATNKQHVN